MARLSFTAAVLPGARTTDDLVNRIHEAVTGIRCRGVSQSMEQSWDAVSDDPAVSHVVLKVTSLREKVDFLEDLNAELQKSLEQSHREVGRLRSMLSR